MVNHGPLVSVASQGTIVLLATTGQTGCEHNISFSLSATDNEPSKERTIPAVDARANDMMTLYLYFVSSSRRHIFWPLIRSES